jgi:hypothetical protein
LLKLLDPALEIRDQFVVPVDLGDHLADPGVGVGELPIVAVVVDVALDTETQVRESLSCLGPARPWSERSDRDNNG